MNGMGIDPMQRMEVRIATLIAEGQERELRVKSLENKVNYLMSIIPNDYNSDVECPTEGMQSMTMNTIITGTTNSNYKLASATAAMGYTNKKQVWGTAFASLLVGIMR